LALASHERAAVLDVESDDAIALALRHRHGRCTIPRLSRTSGRCLWVREAHT
jgi:hypothetical protein